MKKKRKVFIISWFYLIGMIILCLGTIVYTVLMIYGALVDEDDKWICIGCSIFGVFALVFFFVLFGKYFWQWVTIDEKKIISRNIFGILREIEWCDVEEVQGVPIAYNTLDPIMQWFMFIDKCGGKVWVKSPFNRKGECIKIKASKRTRKFLLQLKPDLKFTEYHGT